MLLALWLVTGFCRYAAWLSTVVAFTAFASFSALLYTAGRPSCGCLGVVTTPPGVMLAVDSVTVTVLVVLRPCWRGWPAGDSPAGIAARAVGVAAGVLAVAASVLLVRYGSLTAGLAAVAGDRLLLATPIVDVGSVKPGQVVDAEFGLTNLTDEPADLAAVAMPCRCAVFHELPLSLPARQPVSVRFSLRAPTAAGMFRRPATLQTSAGEIVVELAGVVSEGP